MKPKLSIIIPCLNEEKRLGPTLAALKQQSASPDEFEVVVVDGGSSDRSIEIARSAGAKVIRSERGLGKQRNAGARAATGDWLAFLDADCTAARDWVERAMNHFSRQEVDLLGGPALVPEGGSWVERGWSIHQEMRRRLAPQAKADVFRFISTQNIFVRREAFERVGGFDESLSSGEDTFFGYRAGQQGCRIVYDDALVVCHRGEPKKLRDFFAQQLWHSNREVWRRMATGPRKVGQHAFRYGLLNIAFLFAVASSIFVGFGLRSPLLPEGVLLAYLLIPFALAGRAAWITRSFREIPSLTLLYLVYGIARAGYILGLASLVHKEKRF